MNIGDICTREIVHADRDTSLQHAAALMREHHVGTLLVTVDSPEGKQAVGIVTDRDLVTEAMARALDATQTEIGRFAERKLAAVSAGASVDQAIEAMKTNGVRRLLVSSDDGQLMGVVSLDDVLDAVAHEMSDLARIARAGIDRETVERAPLPADAAPSVGIPSWSLAL